MANHLWDHLFARHERAETPWLIAPDGSVTSHAAHLKLAGRLAGALCAAGVAPGDRVAVQMPKSAEMLALYAACARIGAVFLPLNPAYTGSELDYFLRDSGAALFVADPDRADALRPMVRAVGAALTTLAAGRGALLDAATDRTAPPVTPRGPGDLAAILYTSGTTGRSKGAMLSAANLVSNADVLATAWAFDPGDVLLHALPIFHTHGLFVATNVSLVAGGAMILLPRFETDAVMAALPRATTMMGVPTFYTRLLAETAFDRDLTAHMRLFTSGSAPLSAETQRAFTRRTGHAILERYGMTETNMSTSNPYEGERRPGTVGPALPGIGLRVVDDAGTPVPPGEIGGVEVTGPNVCLGYWQMPDKTAEETTPDGWFRTGDLGQMSPDGYLTIVGRHKDLIISGGLNIYPVEVETVLDALPGIAESAVIGLPDEDLGEVVVAVVVPTHDAAPDPDGWLAEAARHLARFKLPRRVLLTDALPRNAMGKVQKAALRTRYG